MTPSASEVMALPTLAVCSSGGGGEASSPDCGSRWQPQLSWVTVPSSGQHAHSLGTQWGLQGLEVPWRAALGEPLLLS